MKIKFVIVFVLFLSIIACSSKSSTSETELVIKKAFPLSDKDKIEIIGTSDESKTARLVKFKFNDSQINARLRKYDQGWLLDEIQDSTGKWLPVTMISSGDKATKKLDSEIKAEWAQVENIYKRREDLIPNLIEATKGLTSEKEAMSVLVKARDKVALNKPDNNVTDNPNNFREFQLAQDELGSAISAIFTLVEKYPVIKTDPKFQEVMYQIEGTENRITVERLRYNEAARAFNSMRLKSVINVFTPEKQYFKSQ